jgi:hypothetical protein
MPLDTFPTPLSLLTKHTSLPYMRRKGEWVLAVAEGFGKFNSGEAKFGSKERG